MRDPETVAYNHIFEKSRYLKHFPFSFLLNRYDLRTLTTYLALLPTGDAHCLPYYLLKPFER